jgi:hypothetical protein
MCDLGSAASAIGNGFNSGVGALGKSFGDLTSGNIGGALGDIGTAAMDVGGGVAKSVGSLFGDNPSSPQASQALTPTTPSSTPSVTTPSAPVGSIPNISADLSTSPMSANPMDVGIHDTAIDPQNNTPNDPLTKSVSGGVMQTAQKAAGQPSAFMQALGKYGPTAAAVGIPLVSEVMQSQQNAKSLKGFKEQEAKQQTIADNQRALAAAEQQGILPAGGQQMLQHQLDASRAAVTAKYAQMGLSGSTSEQQDLQALNDQAIAQQFQMGQQLASSALQAASAGDSNAMQLMDYIRQTEAGQGTQLSNVLGKFMAAMSGTSSAAPTGGN